MNDSTTYCIYKIVCFPTAKVYVGYSKKPKRRRTDHFRTLRDGTHYNVKLQRAFNKHGEKSFFFEVIEKGLSKSVALEREQYWVSDYDSHSSGFNMTDGGEVTANACKPCTWNGKQYASMIEAANDVGITEQMMRYRVRLGYTSDTDMVGSGQHKSVSIPCIFNGVEYESMTDAARDCGISLHSMQNRLLRGYKCDADVPKGGKRGARAKVCVWNGISYSSIKAAAIALGIPKQTMFNRFKNGYTCDSDMKRSRQPHGCKQPHG